VCLDENEDTGWAVKNARNPIETIAEVITAILTAFNKLMPII